MDGTIEYRGFVIQPEQWPHWADATRLMSWSYSNLSDSYGYCESEADCRAKVDAILGPEPDEEIYHTSDRPSTVREQYEAAWREKQSLR